MLVRQPSLALLLKGTTLISPFIVINENHQLLTLGPNAFVLINIVCIFEQQQSFFSQTPVSGYCKQKPSTYFQYKLLVYLN
ncbi:MAG: hypothetical protein RIS73_927 [Bacteroidota bacterium]|jgi:hypothetical protein